MSEHEYNWGVSGDMIVEPPKDVQESRIRDRDFPFTCRRIAVVEASHYLPEPEAKKVRELIASAPKLRRTNAALLAACKAIWEVYGKQQMAFLDRGIGTETISEKAWLTIRAAINQAEKPE